MPGVNTTKAHAKSSINKIFVLLAAVLVSVAVAITYHYFEAAVRNSINFVWDDLLDTQSQRILVIPVCISLSLLFFGLQHFFDRKSEIHESHGLGEAPAPSVVNFIKVVVIGFFSLFAGASLGPEAILVPACLIIGGYAGSKLFKNDKQAVALLTMVGFVALFAAFFDSFIAGMAGLLLLKSQGKAKITPPVVAVAAIASIVTILMLKVLESSAYTNLPPHSWHFSFSALLMTIVLLGCGYGVTYALNSVSRAFELVRAKLIGQTWWVHGLAAAGGLSVLYLLGGSLIEFTGNASIVPMLQQSASLGVIGLVWLLITKVLAIGWSKKLGYRGGLIFPSIFVASVLVAIAQSFDSDVNFTIGLIAVMVGLIAANSKVKILF